MADGRFRGRDADFNDCLRNLVLYPTANALRLQVSTGIVVQHGTPKSNWGQQLPRYPDC